MFKRNVVFLGALLFSILPVFGEDDSKLLFFDDFEEVGSPNPQNWEPPRGGIQSERLIEVVDENVSEKFGISEGNALRIYKNEINSPAENLSLTAANRFARPAEVFTIAFDFWEDSGSETGNFILRVGTGNVTNAARGHELQFRKGSLSGADGIYQPSVASRIEIVMNNSSQPVGYAEGEVTLESDAFDVWVDGVQMLSNHRWNRGSLPVGTAMTGLQFAVFGSNRSDVLIRNLKAFEGAHLDSAAELGPVELFMAADGSDGNDGLSIEDPIRSLARAQSILKTSYPHREARIRIAPGRYHGQKVQWNHVPVDRPIHFEALDPDLPRPVFDGCLPDGDCRGGTWFRLDFTGGRLSNLVFRNLRIENYQTALSFNGNRNSETGFNGGNVVENCYFGQIGNVSNPSLAASTAVIRFVNSKENRIENNDFIDAINTTSGGLLHAIYVAHLSDRNIIHQNRFIDHSGDPVRVRDFSNGNLITDNVYLRAGAAGYSEWYCDQDSRDDCTKPTPECPSWENEFRRNWLISGFNGNTLPTFVYHQPDSTTGCGPTSPDAKRLSTSGNQQISENEIDLWRHRFFLENQRENLEIAGDFADPAGDGLPNLLKYALGLDPHRSIHGSLPEFEREEETVRLRFWKNEAADDVRLRLEYSEDFEEWFPVDSIRQIGESLDDRVKMEAELEMDRGRLFFRLRAFPR